MTTRFIRSQIILVCARNILLLRGEFVRTSGLMKSRDSCVPAIVRVADRIIAGIRPVVYKPAVYWPCSRYVRES
jgi:hypothetical protein